MISHNGKLSEKTGVGPGSVPHNTCDDVAGRIKKDWGPCLQPILSARVATPAFIAPRQLSTGTEQLATSTR